MLPHNRQQALRHERVQGFSRFPDIRDMEASGLVETGGVQNGAVRLVRRPSDFLLQNLVSGSL
jgi:hypothetical protein